MAQGLLLLTAALLCVLVTPQGCANDCNSNGLCTAELKCKCYSGWLGNDCSMSECGRLSMGARGVAPFFRPQDAGARAAPLSPWDGASHSEVLQRRGSGLLQSACISTQLGFLIAEATTSFTPARASTLSLSPLSLFPPLLSPLCRVLPQWPSLVLQGQCLWGCPHSHGVLQPWRL